MRQGAPLPTAKDFTTNVHEELEPNHGHQSGCGSRFVPGWKLTLEEPPVSAGIWWLPCENTLGQGTQGSHPIYLGDWLCRHCRYCVLHTVPSSFPILQ